MAYLIYVYKSQLEEPASFTIVSFHDCRGVVMNDAVIVHNKMILKQVGDPLVASLEADRRRAHAAFVTYYALFDFPPLILMNVP